MQTVQPTPPAPFRFTFKKPYEDYIDGKPAPIPYVVDGLLTQGGFSILGGKAKSGKSTLSRCLAVSVVNGSNFLGRATTMGDVIIVNLEDPMNHVSNSLDALGYVETSTNGRIVITEKVSSDVISTLDALRAALIERSNTRLVILDHLAKAVGLKDINDYTATQVVLELLHNLAREFPLVHITALAHCKKVTTDDPFDQILGSVALRGEPDTNMIIYQHNGNRVFNSETRVGRAIPASALQAEIVTSAGAEVVSKLTLGPSVELTESERSTKAQVAADADYTARVQEFLRCCADGQAAQTEVLARVTGKGQSKLNAIKQLIADGLITATGKPLMLTLVETQSAGLPTIVP